MLTPGIKFVNFKVKSTNPKVLQNLKFITSPYLSILDLLMNNSISSIESILRNPIIER